MCTSQGLRALASDSASQGSEALHSISKTTLTTNRCSVTCHTNL
jgi:hypothetical protein